MSTEEHSLDEENIDEAASLMKHFHGIDGDHDGSPNRAEADHNKIIKHLASTVGERHPVYRSVFKHLKAATRAHYSADRNYNSDKRGDHLDAAHERESQAKEIYANHLKTQRSKMKNEEVEQYELDEDSIAGATLKAGSRPDENPKSKIEFMQRTLGVMNGMKKEDLSKFYHDVIAQIGKEASSLPGSASADSNAATIDMKTGKGPKTRDAMPTLDHKNNPLAKVSMREDVEEMFTGEELSEEFKDKASTLFEAAVNARAIVEIARLEEEYETRLEEEVTSIVKEIEGNLDNYLDYVVENWMKENEVAIESSLRNEIMEEFIGGLKNLFAEHYIDMPEEKINVVEELAAKVEKLEAALDEAINENAELMNAVMESARQETVAEVSEGLTLSQSEKFLALAEGVDFEGDLDVYKKKLSVVKETYFPATKPQTSNIEEETFEGDVSEKNVAVDPHVNRYVQAISRTVKK